MTVDEYLEHEPEEEMTDSKPVSRLLDTEEEVWNRVWWRLLEEQFLFWYLWLKDNLGEMKDFVQEVNVAAGEVSDDSGRLKP